MISCTNQTIEGSCEVSESIAKHGKPFTDRMFVKVPFLICVEVLFDDLPNKCTIISKIKDMPVSPRTVERRITNMSTDVTDQQTVSLKATNAFTVAPDKNIDISDIFHV